MADRSFPNRAMLCNDGRSYGPANDWQAVPLRRDERLSPRCFARLCCCARRFRLPRWFGPQRVAQIGLRPSDERSSAENASTRIHLGVSGLCTLGSLACAHRAIPPKRANHCVLTGLRKGPRHFYQVSPNDTAPRFFDEYDGKRETLETSPH